DAAADVPGDVLSPKRLVRDAVELELFDLAAQELLERFRQSLAFEVRVDVEEIASRQLCPGHATPLLHRGIPGEDPSLAVEGDESLTQTLHYAAYVPVTLVSLGCQRRHAEPFALLDIGQDAHADRSAEQHEHADRDVGNID